MNAFSKRQGYTSTNKEIIIREDAPPELRNFIVQSIEHLQKKPSFLRRIICKVLNKFPDTVNNWGEYPYILEEVNSLISNCEWFRIYDIIEALWKELDLNERKEFSNQLNDYFNESGIGWKIVSGFIEVRGNENFERVITKVSNVLIST